MTTILIWQLSSAIDFKPHTFVLSTDVILKRLCFIEFARIQASLTQCTPNDKLMGELWEALPEDRKEV